MAKITTDAKGNNHFALGAPASIAGKFAPKSSGQQRGGLGLAPVELAPEDVRNAEHTFEVIRGIAAGNEYDTEPTIGEPDDNGLSAVEWQTEYPAPVWGGMDGFTIRKRATVDEAGEITAYDEYEDRIGKWLPGEDTDLGKLRQAVNDERLLAAGVHIHGKENDGGYSGRMFTGALYEPAEYVSTKEVARQTREQVQEAVRFGALPSNLNYRVTKTSSTGIDITVEGLADDEIHVPRYPEMPHTWGRRTQKAKEIEAALTSIANQWNRDDTDISRDYFDTRYYTVVRFEDSHKRAIREEEAARRKARRAA